MQNQQQVALDQPKRKLGRGGRKNLQDLPPIPDKIYFTIGEVGNLCLVKPYVLRYWEREFPQLNPITRRGNRRYYKRADILLIRHIKSLLYEQGFTIDGARTKLIRQHEDVSSYSKDKFIKNIISQLNHILSELEK